MAKQDFEQFKQDIKEWLNNHPKEQQIGNRFTKDFQIRMETRPSNDA